jgi:hypothetical protein
MIIYYMWSITPFMNFHIDFKDFFLVDVHLVYGNIAIDITMYLPNKLLMATTYLEHN